MILFGSSVSRKIKFSELDKPKKITIILIYILYLFIIATIGFFIYSYFTNDLHPKLTLKDMADPDFKNEKGNVFQKVDDPNLLYVLNPNTSKVYENINYSINSDGFRDREFTIEKTASRIIFLGDSFTFGHDLSLEYTFVKILEKFLTQNYTNNNWETMNFGVSGYNTKWEVDLLEQKGLKYSPDFVILMYYLNDPDGPVENISFAKHGNEIAMKIGNFFEDKLSNQEEKLQVKEFLIQQGIFDKLKSLPSSHQTDYHILIHNIPILWNTVKDSFERLDTLSKKNNFTVIVAILPNLDYGRDNYPYEELHNLVSEESKKHDFYVLDLFPTLSKYPIKEIRLSDQDGHTSYYANHIIAITIKNYLQEKGLIDTNMNIH